MERANIPNHQLGPVPVQVLARAAAVALIGGYLAQNKPLNVAFANTNLVVQTHRKPSIANALHGFLVLNDGVGLSIAAKLFCGAGFPNNLNGTDFTPHLLQNLPQNTKVFLLGSKPQLLQKAKLKLEQTCGVNVVGMHDGYTPTPAAKLCEIINASGAQVLLVGMGNPRQEEWISANAHALTAPLRMGVGALFDFMAGEFARAPTWVQRLHLEWLFRLAQEPRRLARRYTLDIIYFLWVCWRYKRK